MLQLVQFANRERITFAAETNAADTHTAWQRDAKRHNTFSAR